MRNGKRTRDTPACGRQGHSHVFSTQPEGQSSTGFARG